jgi:hypothetical protein
MTKREKAVRCPMTGPAERFAGAAVRCVLDDDHRPPCKLIDGNPHDVDELEPHARYEAMGQPVPARLRPRIQ